MGLPFFHEDHESEDIEDIEIQLEIEHDAVLEKVNVPGSSLCMALCLCSSNSGSSNVQQCGAKKHWEKTAILAVKHAHTLEKL